MRHYHGDSPEVRQQEARLLAGIPPEEEYDAVEERGCDAVRVPVDYDRAEVEYGLMEREGPSLHEKRVDG